jgi:hypothetical protein
MEAARLLAQMYTVCSLKTLVTVYQSTRNHIPATFIVTAARKAEIWHSL